MNPPHIFQTIPHHLKLRNMFLPPDRLLQLRFKSSEKVVEVHDAMDIQVYHAEKKSMSTWQPLCRNITPENHSKVMIAVEEGQLGIFLLHHDEKLGKSKK